MNELSKYQFAALRALLAGAKTNAHLAVELGLIEHDVWPMMRTLGDRGLVKPTGKRRTTRQAPRHFEYRLTAAGRLQAERAEGSIA